MALRRCIITSFELAPFWDQAIIEAYDSGDIKYINGQLELSESGREHLQCYVEFFKQKWINGIKELFEDETLHVEPVHIDRGASTYCLKEETRLEGPIELGIKKKVGGDRRSLTAKEIMTMSKEEALS